MQVFGGNSPHKIVGREPDLPTQSDDEPKKVMQIKMTILQIQVNLLFYYRIMGDAIAAGAKSEWSIRATKMRRIRQNSSRQMLDSRRYPDGYLLPSVMPMV